MNENTTCRIGIGGPVGSGKTALIEAITPRLLDMGYKVLVITNDVVTEGHPCRGADHRR